MVPIVGLSLLALPNHVGPGMGGTQLAYAGTTPAASDDAEEAVPGRAALELPVITGDLPTLKISSLGGAEYVVPDSPGGGGGPRACETVSSHTDADFSGGSFVVQAGFAETEIAAAQYTIPATSFPIKIITTEVIVAQQSAVVATTTKWSMLFWSGRPDTGILVASYSSDGELLPHIQMPPGTNGVNVMFGIDPGDPEQIIINAPPDGSNTFTIGFRIDDHNNQTGTGCSSGDIPSNRNAFPTTDVSGLAFPANNWLRGVNCGSFGCPPNGGWSRFSTLSSFCRPSGDWVMRATWEPVNCEPGVGACCLPSGECQILLQNSCQSQGGTYKGDGSTCGPTTCPAPTGACCFSNNFCLNLTQSDCANAGGSWVGAGTQCNGNQCPTGACCLPTGQCVTATSASCASQGGTFQGIGTSCASTNCPQPKGACCLSNGFCLELTEIDCFGIPGASFKGVLTTCSDGNNNGQADICESASCPADFDQSGFVDTDDFDAFVVAFEAGTDNADFDQSGFVDTDDFDAFVVAFEAGC
ncbi:MAG: hypothetical protein AMXMBFR58_17650 [Phycisphaerae bacterium]